MDNNEKYWYDKGWNDARANTDIEPCCWYCTLDDIEHDVPLGICATMTKFYHCENCCEHEGHADPKSWFRYRSRFD